MRRILATVMVVEISFTGLMYATTPAPIGRLSRGEDYRVYEAYLNSSFAEKTKYLLYENLGVYFIYNVKYDNPDEVIQFFRVRVGVSLDRDMVKNFITDNRSPKRIDRKRFPEDMHYSSQFIQKDVYSLSRVGFNANKDEALFYASFSSLMEDGHGSLVYLKKTSGVWAVVKAAAIWMYGASVHPFNP